MNFVMLPKYHISKILPIYSMWHCLLIKAAMLVFCTEHPETQIATSSLINRRKFSVLFLTTCSLPTASSSPQYSDHSAIVPIIRSMT